MDKQTKIFLSVAGLAVLGVAAYAFIKSKDALKIERKGAEPTDNDPMPETKVPKSQADCPAGTTYLQPACDSAPCPAMCLPFNKMIFS